MREACAQLRNENASRAPSRGPSIEQLLAPKPFIAVDRVSLKTDFDMDNNPEHCNPLIIANNKVALNTLTVTYYLHMYVCVILMSYPV